MEPIHELLQKRYSPRAYADRPVAKETLRTLFEAARWAPSSFNEQPWRFIVATQEDIAEFERLSSCLVPGNQTWAKNAPVLALSVAKLRFARNDKPNRHAFHDVGLAVAQLITQATALGLAVHQMAGFSVEAARTTYAIPEGFEPVAALALGYSAEEVPASRTRRPQDELVFRSQWETPF